MQSVNRVEPSIAFDNKNVCRNLRLRATMVPAKAATPTYKALGITCSPGAMVLSMVSTEINGSDYVV
jgi:hypothetical protein